jgi:hypothetical protein
MIATQPFSFLNDCRLLSRRSCPEQPLHILNLQTGDSTVEPIERISIGRDRLLTALLGFEEEEIGCCLPLLADQNCRWFIELHGTFNDARHTFRRNCLACAGHGLCGSELAQNSSHFGVALHGFHLATMGDQHELAHPIK